MIWDAAVGDTLWVACDMTPELLDLASGGRVGAAGL